jgi:hypothetical protein
MSFLVLQLLAERDANKPVGGTGCSGGQMAAVDSEPYLRYNHPENCIRFALLQMATIEGLCQKRLLIPTTTSFRS